MGKWVKCSERLPSLAGDGRRQVYFIVKFADGTKDDKPFREWPERSIKGFLSEKEVIEWYDREKV